MTRTPLDITGGFDQSVSQPLVNKRLINMYPVLPSEGAFSQQALIGTPGVRQFSDPALAGHARGAALVNGVPYYVIGDALITVAADGTATAVPATAQISGVDDVSIAWNEDWIFIVPPDGTAIYSFFFDVGTLKEFRSFDTLGLGPVRSVTYKAPYFVFTTDSIFFIKRPAEAILDPLDIASADITPTSPVMAHANHNQLYVIQTGGTEVYQAIQTSDFPFVSVPGAFIQLGGAARAVKDFDDGFIMIGSEEGQLPAVWKIRGSSKVKLSTPGIEQIIHSYTPTEISKAVIDSYAQDGALFAVITIGNNTLVYDAVASARRGIHTWHERQTGITDGATYKRWRAQHILRAFGRILVGSSVNSIIGSLDPDYFFDLGDRIERVRQSQPFDVEGVPIFSFEQELFIQSGVGNDDSTDPAWLFKYSDDLGRTWSNRIPRAMGKVGEYTKRLIWRRMGRIPYARVTHFKTDDPVRIAIYKLEAEAEAV